MNAQDLFKRYFWVIGALTVAICAFFGGRAVAHVIEAKVLAESSKPPKVEANARPRTEQPVADVRSKAGRPLADRNIFCSECLPPVEVASAPTATPGGGPPLTQLPLVLIHQNIRPPTGTSRSGTSSTTPPSPSGTPSVSTSERYGPICFGGKLTTATTCRFRRSAFA